jgi:hypothetical protein
MAARVSTPPSSPASADKARHRQAVRFAEDAFAKIPALRGTIVDLMEEAPLTAREKQSVLAELSKNLHAEPIPVRAWTDIGPPKEAPRIPEIRPEQFKDDSSRPKTKMAPGWQGEQSLLTDAEKAALEKQGPLFQGKTEKERWLEAMSWLSPGSGASELQRKVAVAAVLTPGVAFMQTWANADIQGRYATGAIEPLKVATLPQETLDLLVEQIGAARPGYTAFAVWLLDWTGVKIPHFGGYYLDKEMKNWEWTRRIPREWAGAIYSYDVKTDEVLAFLRNPTPGNALGLLYDRDDVNETGPSQRATQVLRELTYLGSKASEDSPLQLVLALIIKEFSERGWITPEAVRTEAWQPVKRQIELLSKGGLEEMAQELSKAPADTAKWSELAAVLDARIRVEGEDTVLEDFRKVLSKLLELP